MVHGSYENRSDRPRRATLVNVFRDGVRSATDEPRLTGVSVIPKGQKIEGQFFPLLFDLRVMGTGRKRWRLQCRRMSDAAISRSLALLFV